MALTGSAYMVTNPAGSTQRFRWGGPLD